MMTLEEAILYYIEDCTEEHRQLAEWLKELKLYRQKREADAQRVTCITCENIDIWNTQGQAAPDCFCRSKVWEELNRTVPHLIGHDPHEPIRCDHWKPKGGAEG